jgi:hypothetical protein
VPVNVLLAVKSVADVNEIVPTDAITQLLYLGGVNRLRGVIFIFLIFSKEPSSNVCA